MSSDEYNQIKMMPRVCVVLTATFTGCAIAGFFSAVTFLIFSGIGFEERNALTHGIKARLIGMLFLGTAITFYAFLFSFIPNIFALILITRRRWNNFIIKVASTKNLILYGACYGISVFCLSIFFVQNVFSKPLLPDSFAFSLIPSAIFAGVCNLAIVRIMMQKCRRKGIAI